MIKPSVIADRITDLNPTYNVVLSRKRLAQLNAQGVSALSPSSASLPRIHVFLDDSLTTAQVEESVPSVVDQVSVHSLINLFGTLIEAGSQDDIVDIERNLRSALMGWKPTDAYKSDSSTLIFYRGYPIGEDQKTFFYLILWKSTEPLYPV